MDPIDTMDHQEVFETSPGTPVANPSPRRRPRLFGQFLVAERAIRARDVSEALALMRLVNSPVGEIAVGEGLLSNDQVETILDAQRHVDEHFFELAASLGLGGQDLEALCSDQAVENLRFGDALVEIGAISSTALEEHLRAYDAEEHFATPYTPQGTSELARTAANLVPRLSRRSLHSSVRFSSARDWDQEALEVSAMARTQSCGGLAIGLSVDESVAGRLGPRRHTPAAAWARKLAPLLLADFVGLTLNMAQQKRGVVHESTLTPERLPARGFCFDVAFENGSGILVIDQPG